jgi:outer membrane protein assembly factor BamB
LILGSRSAKGILTGNDHPIEGSFVMKLYVDTSAKQITVTLEPVEKKDQNGRQRTERDTGRPMWSTQVFVLDDNGGEVITVTTAGERPNVKVGQPVSLSQLEALPWSTNGRSGVAFRASEIKTAMTAVKTA